MEIHLQEGQLRRTYIGNRINIPKEDVDIFYENRKKSLVPRRDEFEELSQRIARLEDTIEVLKMGLGYGSKREPRTEKEIILLREFAMDTLALPGWSTRDMAKFCDDMASLREDDIALLCDLRGRTAWAPMFDLLARMISHAETHPSYPERGLDTLHARMVKARDRIYGLIHASTKVSTPLPISLASDLSKALEMSPSTVDALVADYISAYADAKT